MDLSSIPAIEELRRLTQSLAMLDAIIERNWNRRYYSFNSKWDTNEQMASMRNAEGDSWFLVFGPQGAFLKGFDHESKMSPAANGMSRVWPGVLSDVPEHFGSFVNEPAFSPQDTTFSIWRGHDDDRWHKGKLEYPQGKDPDGSVRLLSILDGNPDTYKNWAEAYYNRPINLPAIEHIYAHKPLTEGVVRALNPDTHLAELSDDLAEIDYPSAAN
jgi:hypothetical protein